MHKLAQGWLNMNLNHSVKPNKGPKKELNRCVTFTSHYREKVKYKCSMNTIQTMKYHI